MLCGVVTACAKSMALVRGLCDLSWVERRLSEQFMKVVLLFFSSYHC